MGGRAGVLVAFFRLFIGFLPSFLKIGPGLVGKYRFYKITLFLRIFIEKGGTFFRTLSKISGEEGETKNDPKKSLYFIKKGPKKAPCKSGSFSF